MNQRTYWNLPIAVAVAASIVAMLVGCGGTRAYPGVASGSAQQSPPTIGYKAYVSSQWLYSFDYPASWYELRDFGLPDVKYFANEQVDSPQRLDANGIWLTVIVQSQSKQACSNSGTSGVTQTPASIDGESTIEYSSPSGTLLYLIHAGWCYSISFIVPTAEVRDSHRADIAHVYSSFRFNR